MTSSGDPIKHESHLYLSTSMTGDPLIFKSELHNWLEPPNQENTMRLLMNAELSTTYADWKKVYDGHKWARDEANMKEILVGWCEEDQRIHVCFEVESMEVMEKFTQKHAEVIASSGHKQETTVVKILSDS